MNGMVGGTQLKPSYEPIIVARKPLDGTCVDNVIKWGVGGINIDECRVIGNDLEELQKNWTNRKAQAGFGNNDGTIYGDGVIKEEKLKEYTPNGRFPANTILTYDDTDFEEVCGGFPDTKTGWTNNDITKTKENIVVDFKNKVGFTGNHYNDSGSASRYFYNAKASQRDRDEGLEEFEEKKVNDGRKKDADNAFQRGKTLRHNTHPTVKSTSLMQYLVRLVTPKGGTVLDPFMGSGSTGKAVAYENKDRNANYNFIGIEKEKEYIDIADARIKYANDDKS